MHSSVSQDVSSVVQTATSGMVVGVATVKFAKIDAATSGNNTLVAAVTGKKIRVLGYTLVSGGTVLARFESGANGTALTGQMTLAANNVVSAYCPHGLFETAAAALLNLELNDSITVDGHLTYIEIV